MNIASPLVSVLIPCYNAAEYVEKAVYSIIQQSYTSIEIIIIDDASTDNTLEKLKSIKDPRIRLIELKSNTQKIGAVNRALQLAEGELIGFQDADDWSEITRIEEQVNIFRSHPGTGICFTKYRYIKNRPFVPKSIALSDEQLKDEFLHFGYKEDHTLAPTICATMMITRQVLLDEPGYHPYFAGRVAEDIHWIYRILKKYKGIAVDSPLYNVNTAKGSLTELQINGTNIKAAYSWQLLAKIIYKDICENIVVLDESNELQLKQLELEACEEALRESLLANVSMEKMFLNSWSYKLGKIFLFPLRLFVRPFFFKPAQTEAR